MRLLAYILSQDSILFNEKKVETFDLNRTVENDMNEDEY